MSLTIESLKSRIAEYEQEIAKTVNTHATLVGGLNELNQLLSLAGDVAEVLDPEAAVVIEEANEVVNEVVNAVDQN